MHKIQDEVKVSSIMIHDNKLLAIKPLPPENVEFDKVLSLLEGFAQSTANKERIRSLSIIRNS